MEMRPIAEVCGDRLGEVRAWIAGGRLPPPEPGDLVPADYLALLDEAGGIEALRAHVEGRYVIAADTYGAVAGPDELDEAWEAYLDGTWQRDLVAGTPENAVRARRLVAAIGRLLDEPADDDWRWRDRLRGRAEHLAALARPGSAWRAIADAALGRLAP